MSDPTIQDFISRMPAAFQPEKAAGLDVIIQLKMTGAQASDYYVGIKDSQCTVTLGVAPLSRLTVTADSADFIKIFSGQLDGMQAFMQGKLRLGGDINLAMKLLTLFKMK